jgi:hypothetical protein
LSSSSKRATSASRSFQRRSRSLATRRFTGSTASYCRFARAASARPQFGGGCRGVPRSPRPSQRPCHPGVHTCRKFVVDPACDQTAARTSVLNFTGIFK